MAHENATVVLGISIPSADPILLVIVGIHVLFGLSAVIAGAVAMLSNKGRGRHSRFGTIYFWSLFGVFVTMSALSFIRWTADYHLFLLGALSFVAANLGWAAARRHWRQWPAHVLHFDVDGVLCGQRSQPALVERATAPCVLGPAGRDRGAADHPRSLSSPRGVGL
jgi:uncharacterized membrane protein